NNPENYLRNLSTQKKGLANPHAQESLPSIPLSCPGMFHHNLPDTRSYPRART
ncbi:hypothetical protein L873DRAFT_1807781, partial [Choiromyces venosus 120613-1]